MQTLEDETLKTCNGNLGKRITPASETPRKESQSSDSRKKLRSDGDTFLNSFMEELSEIKTSFLQTPRSESSSNRTPTTEKLPRRETMYQHFKDIIKDSSCVIFCQTLGVRQHLTDSNMEVLNDVSVEVMLELYFENDKMTDFCKVCSNYNLSWPLSSAIFMALKSV